MMRTNKLKFRSVCSILSVWAALFCILLVCTSCYQFFQGKVAMNADGNSSSIGTLVGEKDTISKLDPPDQIFISHGLSASTITASWSSVTGATSYRLERAVVTAANGDGSFTIPDESNYEVVSKYVYGTSYTDTILSSPSYSDSEYSYGYFYRVSAENPRQKYDSSDYKVSTAGTLFAPVKTVKASLGESSSYIKVTWSKTDNASSYKIYRTTFSDGSGSNMIASITGNQNWYTNTIDTANQGTEFYYTVYAANSYGNTTAASPAALGYSLVAGAPPQVKNVKVTDGGGRGDTLNKISITWGSVTADGTVYYAVYRTSSADSSYTLLKEDITDTSYSDSKSLKPDVYYYYQVQAYIKDGETKLKGPFSDSSVSSSAPAEGYILSAPAALSVTKTSSGCTLSFPAALGSTACPADSKLSSDYNVYSYEIYTCSTQSGIYSLSTTVSDVSLTADNNGYYSVTTDAASFFKIKTYNDANANGEKESSFSDAAAPAPYAAADVTATQHGKFSGGTYSDGTAYTFTANASYVYPVKVAWSAPDEGADGGYYVYRSTKADSGFRRITDTAVTDTLYVDEGDDTVKVGLYYYYKVLSLNSLGQGVNYSAVAVGWGALTYDLYMREYNKTVKRSQNKLTLMHKSGTTSKLGSETISGDICGTLSYNASVQGLGGRVIMQYSGYADYYINSDSSLGYYFFLNGNTNTSASMDQSGSMDGTVICKGMYPGTIGYENVKIIGGAANGGYYVITPDGFDPGNVSYTVGNE
jgi:hypothetical protein